MFTPLQQFCDRLLLRSTCRLCQRPATEILCLDCGRQLQACAQPRQWQSYGVTVWAWGRYEGLLRRALRQVKFERDRELAQFLGQCMAASLADWPRSQPKQLIPIPIAADRLRERGFNQADAIAIAVAQSLRWSCNTDALRRPKSTQALHGLNHQERQQMLDRAFSWRSPQQRGELWLVDDILTTGTTLQEATRTIRAQGDRVRGWLLLSQTPALEDLNAAEGSATILKLRKQRHPCRDSSVGRAED
ncbi:ComF family protein [Synechococcus elongatus]|uniref:ComF family protein n=1 Tax=Synechococcus elongatus PCC 11801 TaxID=2219813 RepID=A0AAQ3RBG9_SYNEL